VKLLFQNLAFFHEKIVDEGGVFDDAFLFNFLGLPLLYAHSFPILPWKNGGCCLWIFGKGPDQIEGKDHVEITVDDHLEDSIKKSKAVIDHLLVF
jgi:hypothetical protein